MLKGIKDYGLSHCKTRDWLDSENVVILNLVISSYKFARPSQEKGGGGWGSFLPLFP